MTLTVRSATVTGATTKGAPLTHAEVDENWNHVANFTQSGNGTSRTAEAKMRDVVSAKDTGAAGDGVTNDDTELDLIEARTEEFIYLPEGNYVTDTELKKRYYGPGKINGKSLFNFDRIQPLPQAARMWHKIRQNVADIQILVLGDSTGNATTEWVYKWATQLGIDAATHSIKYRLFTTTWGSESTISTGSGSQSILVDNASVSGAGTSSLLAGDQRDLIYSLSRTYDVVIFNLGHNEGSSNTYDFIMDRFTSAVIETRTMNPRADLFCTLQNPDTDQLAFSSRTTAAWREISELHGLGAINVADVFTALGNPVGLYTDATHPNEAGMRVWAAVVRQALGESMTHQGHRFPPNCLTERRSQLAPNPFFNLWGQASVPLGWTATNVTAAKDTAKEETFTYALKLTTDSATNPRLEASLATHLPFLKGKWITFIARVWRPTASQATAGRIGIALGQGTDVTSPSFTNVDGYYWSVAHAYIPTNETSITLQILAGTTVADEVWIDRVSCVVGLLPSEPDPHDIGAEEKGDWTPTYTTTGTDFDSVTYDAITSGRYIRHGNKVSFSGIIRTDALTAGSATGVVVIGGLPFTCGSGNKFYAGVSLASVTGFGGDFPINARVTTAGTTIELYYRDASDTTDIALAIADLGTSTNENTLAFSGTYFIE